MFTIVIIEKSVRGETWLDEAGAKKRRFQKTSKKTVKKRTRLE